MDMRFVFLAILLAMFTQTLTSGLPLWQMGDNFVAMSLVVFASLVAKRYLPPPCRPLPMPPSSAFSSACRRPRCGLFIDAVEISSPPAACRSGLRRPLGGRSAGGAQEDVVEGDPHLHDRLHLLLLWRLPGLPSSVSPFRDHLMNHYHIEPDLLACATSATKCATTCTASRNTPGPSSRPLPYCRGLMEEFGYRITLYPASPVSRGSGGRPCPAHHCLSCRHGWPGDARHERGGVQIHP